MNELLTKQFESVRLTGKLIEWAYANGYTLTWGEAYRTPQQAQWNAEHGFGIKSSLHIDRLAVDFNLFKDGKLLNTVEEYRPLGEYWKSLGGTWGGDFNTLKDPYHFSIAFGGRK